MHNGSGITKYTMREWRIVFQNNQNRPFDWNVYKMGMIVPSEIELERKSYSFEANIILAFMFI